MHLQNSPKALKNAQESYLFLSCGSDWLAFPKDSPAAPLAVLNTLPALVPLPLTQEDAPVFSPGSKTHF